MTKNRKRPFDLDQAVATWRAFVASQSSILPEDLEELEDHLRDEFEGARAEGLDPVAAFDRAKKRTGNPGGLQQSYRPVETEKRLGRGQFGRELTNRMGLLGNYVTSVARHALRYRFFTAVNLVGLSTGLAVALVIGLFIRHSLSYDDFHPDVDRIHRLLMSRGGDEVYSRVSHGIAWLIREERADIEAVTQLRGDHAYEIQFTVDGRHTLVDGVLSVDEYFLDVFGFQEVSSTSNPLREPGSVVLTESTARRLFGDGDPVGSPIILNAASEFTVTGVVEDPPPNTHLPFNILVRSFTEPVDVGWLYFGARVYMRMTPSASLEAVTRDLTERFAAENPGALGSFMAESVRDIQLHSRAGDQYAPVGDIRYLYVFGSIGLLILLMAGINYMNLATARAAGRAREVGVRKVVGASTGQIRSQFLLDSVSLVAVSIPLALVMVRLALPRINAVTGETLTLAIFGSPAAVAVIAAAILLFGVGAGAYPSVLMARTSPSRNLIDGAVVTGGRPLLRRILVGLQVAISFGMIAFTLVVSSQLEFIRDQNLGFDDDQVVTLFPRALSETEVERFLSTATESPGVAAAALGLPLGINWRRMSWTRDIDEREEGVRFEVISVGPGFFETMRMPIVAGRNFREEDTNLDPAPAIVSRSYAELYGGVDAVLGSTVDTDAAPEIVGVVEDIRNNSARDEESVQVYYFSGRFDGAIVARLAADRIPEGLAALERAWSSISPERTFDFDFLDERIRMQYTAEQRMIRVFRGFALISLLIAALGLLGLAALTAKQRTKEVGIRKALGATTGSIVVLLIREFMAVVAVSVLVVSPIVYHYGNRWLSGFADRVDLSWPVFAVAAGATFLFVVSSVAVQSFRSASMNPVDSLRTD